MFSLAGSTREHRNRISKSGFATRQAALDAEAQRRIEEQQKRDMAKAGVSVASPPKDARDGSRGVLPPACGREVGIQDSRALSRTGGVSPSRPSGGADR